jgi:hypothetical protein
MDEERITKMADSVASEMVGEEIPEVVASHIRTAAADPDEDVALANVDQALDAVVAAMAVLDDNLPQIKTANVPEKAAVDVVQDLVDSALKPYLADVLKTMQIFK